MDNEQFKMLMDSIGEVRNLLILIASKNKATSTEIGKILNTSDSRVRQILTATGKRRKKEATLTEAKKK